MLLCHQEVCLFHDSYGCLIAVSKVEASGLGPSTRPTSVPSRNMINLGVPWISYRSASSGSTAILTPKTLSIDFTIAATLLKDRLDYLAVCAAVGHELNRDWSLSFKTSFANVSLVVLCIQSPGPRLRGAGLGAASVVFFMEPPSNRTSVVLANESASHGGDGFVSCLSYPR